MKLSDQLPPVLARLLPSAIMELNPIETKATCSACAMAPNKTRRKYPYRADLKCCTFHPWIPNYAVGELLGSQSETTAHGREVLRKKIRRREYALPLGVVPSVRYQVEFNGRQAGEFGQREDWLCPYYVKSSQSCGLWRWRGSVCTGYHCVSDYGRPGLGFWGRLEGYLAYAEMALMEECLVNLDFSPRQISDLLGYLNRSEGTARELRSWVLPEQVARRLWNGYADDQEGFYLRCAEIARGLTPAGFYEFMGERGELLAAEVVAAARVLR